MPPRLTVLKPLTEHEPYDLAIGIGGQLLRVQCKWASRRGEVVTFRLSRNRRGPNGMVRRPYAREEIDAFGVWCDELATAYLIPFEAIPGRWTMQLRLSAARNGQQAALHYAADYELGAVAQLAERAAGSRKVAGSNPASSTLEPLGAESLRVILGRYLERTAMGESFLVTRRGRPVARLLPPQA
jgi:PD-(D/E)XK endonuclease